MMRCHGVSDLLQRADASGENVSHRAAQQHAAILIGVVRENGHHIHEAVEGLEAENRCDRLLRSRSTDEAGLARHDLQAAYSEVEA